MNNNNPEGYLPSVEENLSEYDQREKDELIEKLLEENRQLNKDNRELQKRATTDGMTGLKNSEEFNRYLEDNVSRANRREKFSLLVIDLNDFKGVNDTYNHAKGNKVLKEVSRALENSVREHDNVFRYGGDEFAVQLESSNLEESVKTSQRIYDDVMSLDVWEEIDEEKVDYGLSIGAVEYSGGSEHEFETTADTLYRLADDAMYMAKESEGSDIAVVEYDEDFFDGNPAYSIKTVSDF